jgi:hypothetical protein
VLEVWRSGEMLSDFEREEARYSHPREWYERIEEHTAESRWQTCFCRSCQDKREKLAQKIDPPDKF